MRYLKRDPHGEVFEFIKKDTPKEHMFFWRDVIFE